jgi:SAM-dependent methyltransferase
MAVMGPGAVVGMRLLDVGSGFGSCVLAARDKGADAIGIEIAPFEVEFARRRLRQVRPQDNAEDVYRVGDFLAFEAPEGSFDTVTFWNVLEHVSDLPATLSAARRLLKPGGVLYVVCPNYFAWRLEAHYHVPWKPNPLLPRDKAVAYLKSLGRDPSFFESAIFRRTNWEVLGMLRQLRFEPCDIATRRSMDLSLRNLPAMLIRPMKFARFYNPFCHSVVLAAKKQ